MFPSEATLRELADGMKKLNANVVKLESIFKQILPALQDNTKALRGR